MCYCVVCDTRRINICMYKVQKATRVETVKYSEDTEGELMGSVIKRN